ncbi:MAG: UPF0280 family protein [Syntrophales bacterium]|nr:UPF0280 family protein [Syntrophales bacterium]
MKRTSTDYRERIYRRHLSPSHLVTFEACVKETDLWIAAESYLKSEAQEAIFFYRRQIEEYIKEKPLFLTSLSPLPYDPIAPEIVRTMLRAGIEASVGPMAAVAGAIAEFVGRELRRFSREVIVENGGDIYIDCQRETKVGIYAGESPLSNRLNITIKKEHMPVGVCTSSGTVGHSLSFGKADAVSVISKSAALADAVASYLGNMVKDRKDITKTLNEAKKIEGIMGVVVVIGDAVGMWGDVLIEWAL